ncbi:MAG TPA: hypothetical protein VJ892_01165 [Candidatus Absconditabacterales bacterium]|nr:hypothetical protein [Candidatus Absconditabacterales bacterium]
MFLIKNAMKSLSRFRLIDVIIFECYLLFVGGLLAKLIPGVLGLNVWWYVIVSVLGVVYLLMILVFKRDKKSKTMKSVLDRFHKLTIWQVSVYKIILVIFGFMLMKLFPGLMLIDIARYVAGVGFGAGYFVKMIRIK